MKQRGALAGLKGWREEAKKTTQQQDAWNYTENWSLAHAHSSLCESIHKAD